MKRVLVLIAAGLVSAAPAVGARQTADPLEDLFKRAAAAQSAVTTVRASFTETTVSALLREPLVATGTLVASVPVRVVMTYTAPVRKSVALDAKRLIVVWPSRPEREELDITETQRRIQKYFVDASPKQLRETFAIAAATDAAMRDAYRLDMTPRRKPVAEGLARLTVWIDRTSFAMLKMTLNYPGGDSKTLQLRDVQVNVPIDESAFELLARGRR